MATARERLLQALTAILSEPCNEDGKTALKRLLNSYRVQAKPGENLDKNQTARDMLAASISLAWQNNNVLEKKVLNRIISSFRMQLKQGLNQRKGSDEKNGNTVLTSNVIDQTKGLSRSQIKENTAKQENAYFKSKSTTNDPPMNAISIAGGPKKGSNSRGQCPKCRSIGIVLARAYGGDDYYSCIYCGFQSYVKGVDPKLDLPLAAEILGSSFGDPENENE